MNWPASHPAAIPMRMNQRNAIVGSPSNSWLFALERLIIPATILPHHPSHVNHRPHITTWGETTGVESLCGGQLAAKTPDPLPFAVPQTYGRRSRVRPVNAHRPRIGQPP